MVSLGSKLAGMKWKMEWLLSPTWAAANTWSLSRAFSHLLLSICGKSTSLPLRRDPTKAICKDGRCCPNNIHFTL